MREVNGTRSLSGESVTGSLTSRAKRSGREADRLLTRAQPRSQGALRDFRFHGAVSSSSRLAPARRRARFLKVASAGAAVAGFGILSMLVRGAHTGDGGGAATAPSNGALDVSSRIAQEAEQIGLVLPVRLGRAVAGVEPTTGVDADVMSTTRFRAMGCEIVVGGAATDEAAAIERLFVALEFSLSRFHPDSELERLNRSPAKR